MIGLPLLWADAITRTNFEFGRLQSDYDFLLPAVAFTLLVAFVVSVYRADARELGRGWATLLITLRTLALAGLLVVYLQPQWRNERDVVQPSRTVLLVDTSLSMATEDNDASPTEPNRVQRVAGLLTDGRWLAELRRRQEVSVWRFDQQAQRVTALDRLPAETAPEGATNAAQKSPIAWSTALAAQGTETRLGQALRQVLSEERSAPLAGVVVMTDGQQNAGPDTTSAIALAREAGVPIFPVGIGSNMPAANVRVGDFVVPARAYPGDKYTVSGQVQAQGLAGKTVTVELLSRAASETGAAAQVAARLEASQSVTLAAGGEATPVTFELTPGAVGRTILTLRVKAPPEDRNAADNARDAAIEVVDRKTRVLLFAGGPSREYQFLRNMLHRDKQVEVDVLLQTGGEGISQDARETLVDFPATAQELFDYDAVVAFDPDWRDLSSTQIDLLERWVDRQSGGLIAVAGPVWTAAWMQAPGLDKLRALYPVEFNQRFAVVDDGQYGSKQPWPLEFTRDGLEAQFLWLGDSAAASASVWSDFPGVFGFYQVRGRKPLATVYAHYSDPRTAVADQLPIYLAGQPYGGGQVFYLGSGEMWRLRSAGDKYFEMFYTKLIRHATRYRLLRGSNRGVVQIEGDRFLPGASVEVTARLNNARFEPLELAQVTASAIGPDGAVEPVLLKTDPTRPGHYRGTFVVRKEGSYRVELPVPESNDERLVTAPIQVTIPDLERDHTERNDPLLAELARQTGGIYYVGLDAMLGRGEPAPSNNSAEPLVDRLRDASRITTLAAAPDRLWDNAWMLGTIVGLLCVEWIARRLLKLA